MPARLLLASKRANSVASLSEVAAPIGMDPRSLMVADAARRREAAANKEMPRALPRFTVGTRRGVPPRAPSEPVLPHLARPASMAGVVPLTTVWRRR